MKRAKCVNEWPRQDMSFSTCSGVPPLQPPERWVRGWAKHAGSWQSRVALLIPDCGDDTPPPLFLHAAIRALRADAEEDVVAIVAGRIFDGELARSLRAVPSLRALPCVAAPKLSMLRRTLCCSADHVVIAGSPALSWPRAEQRGSNRAPYHAVWSWCAPGDFACSRSSGPDRSSRGDNSTHVLVEGRRGGRPDLSVRRREREGSAATSGVVEVRSTFTLTWTPLPEFTQAFVSVSASHRP